MSTGKIKWAFQEVHHDIWDYDTPSPVVLFDATTASGKQVKGIGDPGKTGWLYLLDRTNGKPLYGIKETKVPQDAGQKTYATQPIPATSAFIPHGAPPKRDIARVLKERTGALKKVPVVIAKNIFTPPPLGKMLIYGPGPSGGNNWMPSSYNQKTHMFYICSVNTYIGVMPADLPFKPGQAFAGIGGIVRRRLQRGHRHVHGDRRHDGQGRLAEEVVQAVLLRHDDDRRQPGVRRPQQRQLPGLQRHERQAPLVVPDRCRRERHRHDLRERRQAVRRPPLRRQLADGDGAR